MSKRFTSISFEIVKGSAARVSVPCVCPHCGFSMAPSVVSHATASARGISYLFLVLLPNCCETAFYAVFTKQGTASYSYSTHYPNQAPLVLPESLEFSQRFIDLYAQAHTAEINGHIELAGSGYRNALEVLIKDFAITKLKKAESEVVGKKLWRVIEDYLPFDSLKNSADMVRILGNDYTHYQRRYNELEFELLKRYMLIFIDRIDAEILMLEPPIPLARKNSQQQK